MSNIFSFILELKNDFLVFPHFFLFFLAALEIFFPIAIVLLLTNIYDDDSVDIVEGKKFQAFDPMPEKCIYESEPMKYLAYTPDNEFTRKIIKKVAEKFNCTVKNFEYEGNLDDWMEDEGRDGPAVGIIFGGLTVI